MNKDTQFNSSSSRLRPVRFLLLTGGAVFIAEAVIMIVLRVFSPRLGGWEFILDAAMLVLLIAPLLYIWHYRPLVLEMEERMRVEMEREQTVIELTAALERVQTLRGLLPICAWCKHIRDDQGYWQQLEMYLTENSDLEFSHGICPTCAEKLYQEMEEDGEGGARHH